MKILIPLLALVQLSTASASIVGIMDSGTDITHKDLAPKAWVNKNERAGSLVDLDRDGLPGDINGWDYTENSPKVFNNKYVGLINEDVKKFYNYIGLLELGKLTKTSPELAWLQVKSKDLDLMNKVNFVGGYIHGTHVAGIAAKNNTNVKILTMKIIPTEYQELKKAHSVGTKSFLGDLINGVAGMANTTADEFKAQVEDSAAQQVAEMINLHSYLKFHKADVVNQSFGIGFGDAVNFIKSGFISEVKREPTTLELATMVKAYFNQLLKVGPSMFAAAPNTLFVIAAGNDQSNNDLYPDYPANIQADNKIVVAATFGYNSIAEFSNYGATTVDVAAPGVGISSSAPTHINLPLSGTSQAAPYVTNIIAAMKDLNPALSARDLKAIVFGTVDQKSWLRGKVKTAGIVNRARALKAAEFAKMQTVDLAISKARATIADVAVMKSLTLKPEGVDIKFKPLRPSLLIPKI